jgi:MoaA/NifB/PqqE/SkfB family radical SAM enzyme
MCGAWSKQHKYSELSPVDIKKIFSDKILHKSIKVVNITGGEPTLRKDLIEVIKTLVCSCVNLERIDVSTNGIRSEEVIDAIEQALAFLLPYKIKLSTSVSLDGIGQIHDEVRGTPGAFEGAERTISELKEMMALYPGFSVGLNFTVNRNNSHDLDNVFKYGIAVGLGVNFTLAANSEIGVESLSTQREFALNDGQKKSVAEFISRLKNSGHLNTRYADFILHWLSGGMRRGPCVFQKGMSILCEPEGTAYACGNFKDFRIGNLLEKPFSEIIIPKRKFRLNYKKMCIHCNSNCYIESAR